MIILKKLYGSDQGKSFVFKGGTALRLAYGSQRFSEDLDFSTNLRDVKVLEQTILLTLQEIEREGVVVSLKEAKETSGGYLAIVGFETDEKSVVIQLEISLRQGDKKGRGGNYCQ